MNQRLFWMSSLALTLLAALVPPAAASPVDRLTAPASGNLQFDLSRPEYSNGQIDVMAALSSTAVSFTQVRATFTAQVLGAFNAPPAVSSDYALLSRQYLGGPDSLCNGSSQSWCEDQRLVYERTSVMTMTQAESWLNASIGTANGRSSTLDASLSSRQEDQGTSLDSSTTTHTVEPWSTWYDENGQVTHVFYADLFKTEQYQTHSFTNWVYSPVTTLSVVLDLGADELAALSTTGTLQFGFGSNVFTASPVLLLEYSTVSAIPEPQTAVLMALGLAALVAPRMTRHRQQRRSSAWRAGSDRAGIAA